jgi:hypothetical protein
MPRGFSIHVGVNSVDTTYGESKTLRWAEADAKAMAAIAEARGFECVKLFLTCQATLDTVTAAVESAAKALVPEDILLLTFACHGAFVRDTNGDETDGRDETLCLYDWELVDDQLYGLLSRFKPGVRVLVVSDSCHSGTVAQFIKHREQMRRFKSLSTDATENAPPSVRALSAEEAWGVYQAHRDVYDSIQNAYPQGRRIDIGAHVLLLSACQDWELAYEGKYQGKEHGDFTAALLEVWNDGAFDGNYLQFHEEIHRRLQQTIPLQRPGYLKVGVPSAAFDLQKPFAI